VVVEVELGVMEQVEDVVEVMMVQGVVVAHIEDLVVGAAMVGLAVEGPNVNQWVAVNLIKSNGLIPRSPTLI
jgi:hypothetical protein